MKHSEQFNEVATALLKAQGDIGHALKDKDNPYYSSKYADLAGIKDVCIGPLTKAGVLVLQTPATSEDGAIVVTTRLIHAASGQWFEDSMSAKAAADNKGNITAQAMGSVVTYLRRYMLSTMANVATEDDDGEGAAGRTRSDGDKMKPTGEPDRIDIAAADFVVPDEFWERPNLGLAKEPGWKINDWLAHFGAYVAQAPDDVDLDRFWRDNEPNIHKLSDVRQYWCREVWTAAMSAIMPPDVTQAG